MWKRILLAVTFVAALGIGGLGMSQTAEARHGCYRSYPRAYHSFHHGSYGPRVNYYRHHSPWYGHHRGHHRGHHSGFYLSIGL